jgi:cell division protein FtsB
VADRSGSAGDRRPAQPSRPRTPRAGSGPDAPVATRASLTGRAAVLALVVCLLAISLAYPLREFLQQRAEIGDYEARVASQEQEVAELRRAERRWKDPAFIRTQARDRLHFVMPGEVSYVVLEPDEAPAPVDKDAAAARPEPERPWFGDLWESVEEAGRG